MPRIFSNNRGSATTSVSGLQFKTSDRKKCAVPHNDTNKSQTSKGLCGQKQEHISDQTLSIHNLEFPVTNTQDAKGTYKVKRTKDLIQSCKSKSDMISKQRGYDFTSSTNSHFEDWLFPVPPKFRHKCPSTSTEGRLRDTTSSNSEMTSFKSTESQDKVKTSEEMINSLHKMSEKPKRFNGPEWRKPCKESFVAGAPPKFIGTCSPNIEQIAKMTKTKQKFFLTQDPRKVHCLVNPEVLRSKGYSKKKEFDTLTKMVKHAQNICASDAVSESPEAFICEVIDMENPLQMDFQGLDYKNTYRKDEQDLLNQRNYRRMCRYIERQRVKADTKIKVEEEKHQEKLQVPPCFKVRRRISSEIVTATAEPVKSAKLLRSGDKPGNLNKISMERKRREMRYKDLYMENRARKKCEEKSAKQLQIEYDKNIRLITADKNIQNIITDIDAVVNRSYKLETVEKPLEVSHFTKGANSMKSYLEPNMRLNKKPEKLRCPNADSDTPRPQLIDRPTNDEDNANVGKDGNIFWLRGIQSKSSKNIKGRILESTVSKVEGCITREQWLMELAPKKDKVKLDVEVGVQKLRSPDDPKLLLFDPNIGYKPPKHEFSEVKDFTLKPLARHYDRMLRKTLKFAKPRLKYSVKKFNLVSYRFGDTAKRLSEIKDPLAEFEKAPLQLKTTVEYIQSKIIKMKRRQAEMKMKRLDILGIPCKPVKKSRLQTKCENSSSSSDSEWVPEKESDFQSKYNEEFDENVRDIMPLNMRTNMPAPMYREPTLRQHPRRRRDYETQRIPSDIFDQVVLQSNHPHMYKLPPDTIQPANPSLKNRPYFKMFDGRHHHDHWNPIKGRMVDVHYQPHLAKPKITNIKRKADRIAVENFHMANPPCNRFVEMNLTMPKWNIDVVIHDYRKSLEKESGQNSKETEAGTIKISNLCKQQDFELRSRDPREFENLDYPGRKEYLKLLRDVKVSVKESTQSENPSNMLYMNKEASLEDLGEDLKSIESCLTSLSSSECTNLTNDSGSFLLMDGKEKVPLDYIRKSVVPFEELQRSRFQAEPIDVDKEDANPFNVLPFSGQKKAQLELTTPKDSFFTFTTRLKNGLRLRLEVPVEDVRKKLIGKGTRKYNSVVATDIDENYVEVLKCRPSVKTFNFKSCSAYIKDAMRLKFESMLVQGQMVRTKIYDRLNEQHWTDMQRLKLMYEKLFAKWEKKEYDAAMAVVYKVKAFYDETDSLKNELKNLDKELVILNMDIVFIEGHWILCLMLQNFHYLLGDQEWRLEHDWIHRVPTELADEVVMENFEDSILKRSKVNIRQREKDDAWAIKAFYEEVYLPNKHPNLIVFPDADSFLQGLENLKGKTFVLLLEMHFTLAVHTELQGKLETFIEWCADDLKEKRDYVSRKCAKLYFMEDRADWLRRRTLDFLEEPIDKAFNHEVFLKNSGIISEAWRRIVPANLRGGSSEQLEAVHMVAMMSDVIMELISKFEAIPMEDSLSVENKIRARRSYLRKQSRHACDIERRIEQEMIKVNRNLGPPYRKPKRATRLQRYYLKKRTKTIQVQEKKITNKAKFFFNAFNEDGGIMQVAEVKDSIAHVDTIQEQIVPFYFDHFLKLNGYTPNYNFKTRVETRDGPELERMQVRSVIPEIQERMMQWELMKRKIMYDNIAQNPKMYIDVV